MATTVAANFEITLSTLVTLTGNLVSQADKTYTLNGLNEAVALNASSTPPITKASYGEVTMSSGTGSINLAALPGQSGDETVVGTGLKLQALIVRNKSTNANKITVAKGGSNGYGLNAAEDAWTVTLDPGCWAAVSLKDTPPDVASGKRVIDVTGTGAQVLEFAVLLG